MQNRQNLKFISDLKGVRKMNIDEKGGMGNIEKGSINGNMLSLSLVYTRGVKYRLLYLM